MYNKEVKTSAESFIVSSEISDDSSHAYFAHAGIYHDERLGDDEVSYRLKRAQQRSHFVRANYVHRGCTYVGLMFQKDTQP